MTHAERRTYVTADRLAAEADEADELAVAAGGTRAVEQLVRERDELRVELLTTRATLAAERAAHERERAQLNTLATGRRELAGVLGKPPTTPLGTLVNRVISLLGGYDGCRVDAENLEAQLAAERAELRAELEVKSALLEWMVQQLAAASGSPASEIREQFARLAQLRGSLWADQLQSAAANMARIQAALDRERTKDGMLVGRPCPACGGALLT